MKIKTFGFITKLLRKTHDTTPDSAAAAAAIEPAARAVRASNASGYSSFAPASVPKAPGVQISLQKILAALPVELQPRVRQANVGQQTIAVRLEKILPQLSKGAVKLSFGELRQIAPGVFSAEPDQDQVLVTLPLGDILSQLNPAFITRRRMQQRVEVPADISSPFDPSRPRFMLEGNRETEPRETELSETEPADLARPSGELSEAPLNLAMPARGGLGSVPPPAQPAIPLTAAARPSAAKSATSAEPLLLAIGALAKAWPDGVRQEILALNLLEARVAIPAEAVEQGLKQGKISFTWKMIRSWVEPAAPAAVSPHDGCVLDLSLKLVVPLFLARQPQAGKTKQNVSIDEDIPNPFSDFVQAETHTPPAAPQARPSDTNDSARDDSHQALRVQPTEVEHPMPAAKPVAKRATPKDVVSRAAALDGVAGALLVLPDGLMVAHRLPPDLDADSIAAFLPQIYGKVSQCTKVFRMGELNDLDFTVGNIPWKILRGNATFFGVFGREGEPLPTAQLAALAAELDQTPN